MKSFGVKYRPDGWGAVVGQESAVKILRQQVQTKTYKNAYIFSGASGCGKTTCARIFAQEINNHHGTPIEIDAASNNGVDNVRQISDSASARAIDSEYKIYIIDECHVLSNQAWNAFLKTIEETPKYTVFIFCTTDPQKIPDTIKNRCMRFNFTRLPSYQIKSRLEFVCNQEGFTNYIDACDYISRICRGEMRNALSLLETCADYSKDFSIDNVVKAIGNYSYSTYFDLVNSIIDGDIAKTTSIITDIYNEGNDLTYFVNSFLSFVLDVTKYIICKDIRVTKLPATVEDQLKFATGIQNASKYYMYITDKLLELKNMIKNDDDVKSTVEVIMIQMCRLI